MAATTRLIAPKQRGMATGVVNAGGSFGQFLMAPIAGALIAGMGWASALQIMGLLVLLVLLVLPALGIAGGCAWLGRGGWAFRTDALLQRIRQVQKFKLT